MIHRTDMVIVTCATALALGTTLFFSIASPMLKRPKALRAENPTELSSVIPLEEKEAPQESRPWAAPVDQRESAGWIYDLFTPPEIFYDADANRFRVTPPTTAFAATIDADIARIGAGIRLVEVQRPEFPLQLIGFVGSGQDAAGLFQNAASGETFLGRDGMLVRGLNLLVEKFEVSLRPVLVPDSMTTDRLVATASVREQSTGDITNLTTLARSCGREAIAVVATENQSLIKTHLKVGDRIDLDGRSLSVKAVQVSPPTLVLSWQSDGTANEAVRIFHVEGKSLGNLVDSAR